jgi:hypothetical protein
MPRETLSSERAQELEKALSPPKEIVADQATARRLDELCSVMTDTCGQIEATLQLAVEDQNEKRAAYIRIALNLSARGTKAVKMFLSEWRVLVEESKSVRTHAVEEPDFAVLLNSMTAHTSEVTPK